MKRIFLCTLAIILFASCGTDLTNTETSYDNLESDSQNTNNKTNELDKKDPKLISISFLSKDNPTQLVENVNGEIINDSIVEFWVKNIMSNKLLVPHFNYIGENLTIDNTPAVSDETKIDFKTPVKLTISNQEKTKEYIIYVHSFTGLPVLWIETEGRAEIISKDEYINAHLKIVEDVHTRSAGNITETDVKIKGRGNSTWGMPKKPYALKFNKKTSLLDEPEDKSWVLLANYADKTSLRNQTAFYMGSISNLEYTPRFHFVDLMLNGAYNGTYQLGEKLKISINRVNVGDDGFLLEIDSKAGDDEPTFQTKHQGCIGIHNGQPINIKEPDVVVDDENYNYIKNYVITAENALFSDNFKDPEEGWQKYMDMDSFVDWFLINEIAKNNDACFFSSCYMHLKRGEKLKMGPIWDFDIAFGNINYLSNYLPEGFWIKNVIWYSRLFEDPAFVAKVKERFNYFYLRKNDIMNEINANAQYLKFSTQENNNKWHTFYTYTWPNYDIWGSYQNEVQSMKEWLDTRFEWLKAEFDKM